MRFQPRHGNRKSCAQRVGNYEPKLLDELCLSGEVMWARVSPHPCFEDGEGKRIRADSNGADLLADS